MSKKKVYIAASYTAHALAEEVAGILEPYCEVVSTWHKPENVVDDDTLCGEEKESRANIDVEQICYCDWLLYLSTPHKSCGGKDFEMGYAFGSGKCVYIFGSKTHIFTHCIHNVPLPFLIGAFDNAAKVRCEIQIVIDKHVAALEAVLKTKRENLAQRANNSTENV